MLSMGFHSPYFRPIHFLRNSPPTLAFQINHRPPTFINNLNWYIFTGDGVELITAYNRPEYAKRLQRAYRAHITRKREREELMLAFAMGLHAWLGAGSRVSVLDKDTLSLIKTAM